MNVRCWCIGDTICTTPTIREIRRTHPNAIIDIITLFPEIFKYNQNVNNIIDRADTAPSSLVDNYIMVLDVFNSENQMQWVTHSVEYSVKSALKKSLCLKDQHLEVNYSKKEKESALNVFKVSEDDKIILAHPHRSAWETRNWGVHNMAPLVKKIKEAYPNYRIISVGGSRADENKFNSMKNKIYLEDVEDYYGKFSLLETLAIMDLPQVKLLITPDTGTLHMGATRPELPIVGIFTLIKSEFRIPTRHGVSSYKFSAVETDKCNCTYYAKSLITKFELAVCPKREFLKRTINAPIPIEKKLIGLKNYNGKAWQAKNLEGQITKEIKK